MPVTGSGDAQERHEHQPESATSGRCRVCGFGRHHPWHDDGGSEPARRNTRAGRRTPAQPFGGRRPTATCRICHQTIARLSAREWVDQFDNKADGEPLWHEHGPSAPKENTLPTPAVRRLSPPAEGGKGQIVPETEESTMAAHEPEPEARPTTYRERRLAKADRLRGWADRRDEKAEAAADRARQIGDLIPMGQPILVGHHSESRHRRDIARMQGATRASLENQAKARDFRSRAAGIEAQAAAAIYDDDPAAVERLEERIATLEAERDRVKRFNASCRKKSPDYSILTPEEVTAVQDLLRVAAFQCTDKNGTLKGFPAYHLSNLSANIRRQQDRLAQLRRKARSVAAAEADGGVTVRALGPNRVTVTFADKPDAAIRAGLKDHGFRWVRTEGCWAGRDLAYAELVARTVGTGT